MSQDNRSKIGLIFVKFDIFSQNTVIYTGNYAKTDFPVKTSLMWGLFLFFNSKFVKIVEINSVLHFFNHRAIKIFWQFWFFFISAMFTTTNEKHITKSVYENFIQFCEFVACFACNHYRISNFSSNQNSQRGQWMGKLHSPSSSTTSMRIWCTCSQSFLFMMCVELNEQHNNQNQVLFR